MTEKSFGREQLELGERVAEQKIEVFEGLEGTRRAIERVIEAGKDYQHFIGYPNKRWEETSTEWARQNIVPKKVSAGIKSTGIYYPTETIKKVWQPASSLELRDVNLLPETHQLPLRFYIYGDTVLFIEEIENDFRSLEITDLRIAKEMRDIFERFLERIEAPKEKDKIGREVDLYLIRHGEAESQAKDAMLSTKGKLQAEAAVLQLLADIWSQGGGLLKFNTSPTPRARETFAIMERTAHQIIEHSPSSPVKLYRPRMRPSLEAAGVIGPLTKMGIRYEDTIEYWLTHPETVEEKTPSAIYARLQEFLLLGRKLADRLPSGEKIFYVGITHEVPQAALLHHATGKRLSELGGSIQNCEFLRLQIRGKSEKPSKLVFRGSAIEVPLP